MPEAQLQTLLVTRNYPPLVGGMERVAQQISVALAESGSSFMVGPKGCARYAPACMRVYEAPLRPLWRFLLDSTVTTARVARRERPALVVGGSGLVAPTVRCAARLARAKTIVYVHGLDITVASRIYQSAWVPSLRKIDRVICNSENTRRLALDAGVRSEAIRVLNPGTDVPPPVDMPASDFRERHGLGARPLLLSVGRFTRRKGLAEFVANGLPAIVAEVPEAMLLVIGGEASDALSGGAGEWARIDSAARQAGVSANLRCLGRCSDEELAAAYASASCHVFPVIHVPGDVEGFGMVALESAARGLPTVAFRMGGIPDAVLDGVTGCLVEPGDYSALALTAVRYLRAPPGELAVQAMRDFARARDWSSFRERFLEIAKELR